MCAQFMGCWSEVGIRCDDISKNKQQHSVRQKKDYHKWQGEVQYMMNDGYWNKILCLS